MNNRLVVDTSVYITYAMYDKLYRLVDVRDTYGVRFFVNEELLDELKKNLQKVLKGNLGAPEKAMNDILFFATIVETYSHFTKSPDQKDNFLFDLAIQTNSEVIVTKENALLNFKESPIPIHDIKWFKETFPVPQ